MDREDIFDALTLMGGGVQIRLPVELDIPESSLYPYNPQTFFKYALMPEWVAGRYSYRPRGKNHD